MWKSKSGLRIALVGATVAMLAAPATALPKPIIGHGYACYPKHTLYQCKGCTKSPFNKWVNGELVEVTLQQCFDACNATPGRKGVDWVKVTPFTVHLCYLVSEFKSIEYVGAPSSLPGDFVYACVKLPPVGIGTYPKPGDPPWTYQEIPPKIPHDQFRQQPMLPTPQPGPAPGRSR